MITQHSVRSIITPPIEAYIKASHNVSDNQPNKAQENHRNWKTKYPLKFNYYRNLINKLYSSAPKTPKK